MAICILESCICNKLKIWRLTVELVHICVRRKKVCIRRLKILSQRAEKTGDEYSKAMTKAKVLHRREDSLFFPVYILSRLQAFWLVASMSEGHLPSVRQFTQMFTCFHRVTYTTLVFAMGQWQRIWLQVWPHGTCSYFIVLMMSCQTLILLQDWSRLLVSSSAQWHVGGPSMRPGSWNLSSLSHDSELSGWVEERLIPEAIVGKIQKFPHSTTVKQLQTFQVP